MHTTSHTRPLQRIREFNAQRWWMRACACGVSIATVTVWGSSAWQQRTAVATLKQAVHDLAIQAGRQATLAARAQGPSLHTCPLVHFRVRGDTVRWSFRVVFQKHTAKACPWKASKDSNTRKAQACLRAHCVLKPRDVDG